MDTLREQQMTTYELKNGNRNVISTVSIPEDLHRVAKNNKISLSATLRDALADKILNEGLY